MKIPGAIATVAILFVATQAAAQTNDPTDKQAPPDWITTSNKPCKVWNPTPQPNESVTWSGACKDGFASGKGILFWTENGKPDVEYDGEYANGKRNGHGVMIFPDGKRIEGFWVNDEILAGGDTGDAI
jgi:MORN repeat